MSSKPSYIPSYKPLDITLIRRDKQKKHLRDEAGISGTTLAKMSNNDFVSLSVIARICEYLKCNVEDVVEFVDEKGRRIQNNHGFDAELDRLGL